MSSETIIFYIKQTLISHIGDEYWWRILLTHYGNELWWLLMMTSHGDIVTVTFKNLMSVGMVHGVQSKRAFLRRFWCIASFSWISNGSSSHLICFWTTPKPGRYQILLGDKGFRLKFNRKKQLFRHTTDLSS